MPDFGDHVRIKATEETERLGFAGREGIVFGWTTPSLTRVDVVGPLSEDFAFNVNFEDLNQAVWFAADLMELLDHAPGQVFRLDGVDAEWVRLPNGEWEERPRGSD
jgi:hypothetical protein